MARRPLNECTGCGEDFTSVSLFDRHRVGVHAYTFLEGMRMEPPREDGRRCLGVDEMEQRGWDRRADGRWHDPAETERTRKNFSRVRGTA